MLGRTAAGCGLVLLVALAGACGGGGTTFAPADVVDARHGGPDVATDVAPDAADDDAFDAGAPPPDVAPDAPDGRDGSAEIDAPPPCATDADCADDDPCTVDTCTAEGCQHTPEPAWACCATDADCDDGVTCTADVCAARRCYHDRSSNRCCVVDGDCDDEDACTLDVCVGETCAHVLVTGGSCACTRPLDCDDGLDCTAAVCDEGRCVVTPAAAPGCCTSDADCGEGARCRLNTCEPPRPRPCREAADCDDGNACTAETCSAGLCGAAEVAGCCRIDAQCDDGLPETADSCREARCAHAPGDPPATCAADGDCDDGRACTVDACVGGVCSLTIGAQAGCCRADAACDDADPCTDDACEGYACVHPPAAGPVRQVGFDFGAGGLDGFAVEDDGSGARWQLSPRSFLSPPSAAYFGVSPENPTLETGTPVAGTLTSPAVDLPADRPATLAFGLFFDAEPLTSRDVFTLQVVVDGNATVAWSKDDIGGSTQRAWAPIEVDLGAWAGRRVQLAFAFDSVDATNNDYEGVYLDDLELRWGCAAE